MGWDGMGLGGFRSSFVLWESKSGILLVNFAFELAEELAVRRKEESMRDDDAGCSEWVD